MDRVAPESFLPVKGSASGARLRPARGCRNRSRHVFGAAAQSDDAESIPLADLQVHAFKGRHVAIAALVNLFQAGNLNNAGSTPSSFTACYIAEPTPLTSPVSMARIWSAHCAAHSLRSFSLSGDGVFDSVWLAILSARFV